ncbi:uncharacterized protein LOC124535908 [Vanessa cardui]|uniref:uncharacterized protein LOC124535908 n=1 Tax=Vanessa cardui TaxID=171605 RepID=UPI001F12F0CA|nr:uncharacterized protein LOC124535908 [Vanessa cardui]
MAAIARVEVILCFKFRFPSKNLDGNLIIRITIFLAVLFAVIETQAIQLDPGPQAIKDSLSTSTSSPPATQNLQTRYATHEIILYLTPSQIKALQAEKGLEISQPISQSTETQEQNDQRLTSEEHEQFIRQQFENIKSARIAQPKKSPYDNLELVSHGPSYNKGEVANENQQKYSDLIEILKQNQPGIDQQTKPQYLFSQLGEDTQREQNERDSERVRNAWIGGYGSVSDKKQEELLLHEQLKQQWNRILEHNRNQLKSLSTITAEKEKSQTLPLQTEKPLPQLQYAPRYNDQKYAIEIENILRNRHRQELEKESALLNAEGIANSPPVLIHQEIRVTKHRPVPIPVKHVKVQVPTPVLVPVPEPFEVKVPHPYPVPFEVIKHIPVPILKTQTAPAPVEVEKQIKLPFTKNVYGNVDRPYYFQKFLPVQTKKVVPGENPSRKAEKVTYLRHVWQS